MPSDRIVSYTHFMENQSKIISLENEAARKIAQEGVQNDKVLLKYDFDLLKGNIDLLKQSEERVKEMIAFSKENAKQGAFLKEYGYESAMTAQSYTVGDIEKEMQSIQEIKDSVAKIHASITESQIDVLEKQELLNTLDEMDRDFRKIMVTIDPYQGN